mgnify:CR=1 FL=1
MKPPAALLARPERREELEKKGVTKLDNKAEPVKIQLGTLPKSADDFARGTYYVVPVLERNSWLNFHVRNEEYKEDEAFAVRTPPRWLDKYASLDGPSGGRTRRRFFGLPVSLDLYDFKAKDLIKDNRRLWGRLETFLYTGERLSLIHI